MNTENSALDFRDPGPMSNELLSVPGFVNELKNHTLAVAPRPNEPLAFAGILEDEVLPNGKRGYSLSDAA